MDWGSLEPERGVHVHDECSSVSVFDVVIAHDHPRGLGQGPSSAIVMKVVALNQWDSNGGKHNVPYRHGSR